jgi:hypothetical protein
MAIVNATVLLVGLLLLAQSSARAQGKNAAPAANPSPNVDTVVFLAQADLERLVMVEARQEQKRLLSVVPVGRFKKSFNIYIAQKNLVSKDQARTGGANFLPALFEFTAPRLAVYSDKNPCSDGTGSKEQQPMISVAGIPFFKIDAGSTAKYEVLNPSKKMLLTGLSKQEQDVLQALANVGFGIVQATFVPSMESSDSVKVMPALHLAWEDANKAYSSQIVGKHGAVVERLFLSPESVEVLGNVKLTSFPTGIELPPEAADVFPSIYTDWAAGVLAKEEVIKAYTGPLNRCELCYEKPPTSDVLHNAGVFWQTKTAGANPTTLRGRTIDGPAGQALETWLSRHLLKKTKNKDLLFSATYEGASVSRSFVEQGSVERPFLGEIICPAMEGYQKKLTERREKTLVALNALNGWNEQKLKTKTDDAGVVRPSWFQEHWEKKP